MQDGLEVKCQYWFCWNTVCTSWLSVPFNASYTATLITSQEHTVPCLHWFPCRASPRLFLALEEGTQAQSPPLCREPAPAILVAWMEAAHPILSDSYSQGFLFRGWTALGKACDLVAVDARRLCWGRQGTVQNSGPVPTLQESSAYCSASQGNALF